VLNLKDPGLGGGSNLLQGLLDQWPSFFAFVTSFMSILIMWVGHHEMFNYIMRIDRQFMFLNGFLLLFLPLTPFTTSLIADHMMTSDSRTAAAVYSGSFLLLSISWNFLWRHAASGRRLLAKDVTDGEIRTMRRSFYVAPTFYSVAFVIAFVSGLSSFILMFGVAVFYAVGTTSRRLMSSAQ